MQDTVASLATSGRVLTFSLLDAPLDAQVRRIEQLMDDAGVPRAVICGVSYGGWVAIRFATERPNRVSGLVLVSAPGPVWRLDSRAATYLRAPRAWAPFFLARAVGRLGPELKTALPSRSERVRFLWRFVRRVARAPLSPSGMAARAREMFNINLSHEAERISVPTLIITGESDLDRVVPVSSTREYLSLIPGSRHAVLERTGHLGCVTRPHQFAGLVASFAEAVR
jgi:pimeloyl-ACP methyl ester carboxylesterase